MRLKYPLMLCAIGLISLAGCANSPTPSASNSPESSPVAVAPASPEASPATNPEASPQSNYSDLLSVVSRTQAAVDANDFAKAQQEFDQFEGVWSQVEDGIKEKSPERYDAIESDMDKVMEALRSSQADQVTTALKDMTTQIEGIPQS